MDMRQTLGSFTTATGTLLFPLSLNEPDTKFDDSEDKIKYKATIRLDGEAAAELLKLTEDTFAKWLDQVKVGSGKKPKTQAKNIQWFTKDTKRWDEIGASATQMLDEIQEGEVIFKLTHKAFRKMRNGTYVPQRPAMFDSEGNGISEDKLPLIGHGSRAQLSGQFYGWTSQAGVASMSLMLRSVMLIDVVEPGQHREMSAESFGFTPTEGFVVEPDANLETLKDSGVAADKDTTKKSHDF